MYYGSSLLYRYNRGNHSYTSDYTVDNPGTPVDCLPFISDKVTINEVTVSGQTSSGLLKLKSNNNQSAPIIPAHLAVSGISSDGFFASQLAEMTNPSRDEVNIAETIGELANLPLLTRTVLNTTLDAIKAYRGGPTSQKVVDYLSRKNKYVGDPRVDAPRAARDVAKADIIYQFGVKPLLSDLRELMDINNTILSRTREYHSLHAGRGLRRNVTLWTGQASNTYSVQLTADYLGSVSGKYTRTTSVKVRGHIRWKPIGSPPLLSDAQLNSLIKNVTQGLTWSQVVKTGYQLYPWSFLVDYFTSLGDFIGSSSLAIPAIIERAAITKVSETRDVYHSFVAPNGHKATGGVNTRRTINRTPALPSVDAYLGYLTSRQAMNLSSLALIHGL
jgi:hypothetical protein